MEAKFCSLPLWQRQKYCGMGGKRLLAGWHLLIAGWRDIKKIQRGIKSISKPPRDIQNSSVICQDSVAAATTTTNWLNLVPHRPPYVVLCDFDEFWIYNFNTQLQEPLDRVKISELPARHSAPIFGNNWVEATREAANDVALAFNEMVHAANRVTGWCARVSAWRRAVCC